jgi:phosphatidylinositol alpha-1,6-mannosyltransferase
MLLIVGDAPSDALHARSQSPNSIRMMATRAGVDDNLRFLGKIPDDELETAYSAADVHVFPVREIPGDPEGFGMVAVEAAAHGLPTVAFATGGVVDAVAEGKSGYLVQSGDYAAFAQRVIDLLERKNTNQIEKSSRAFAQEFAWERFGKDLARLLLP